jgi:L-aspartate oxidase
MKHIIVVGSGIAGLIAAIEISSQHAVTLVTKAVLAESNTRWAQGGIAAAMFSDDSVADHIADTLTAGAGLCNPAAVDVLCSEGPDRIRDLIRLGVAFDHAPDGQFSRGLEAAHSYPRVLHAGGDATGLTIETALVRAVRANSNISVLEHTFAVDITLKNGLATALQVIDSEGINSTIDADAIILASGGAGQLYLHTTNPSVATGDGVAMALRAGAALADTEFYQFHPTALATPGTFLISEAVRGEGATLLDATGHRFMQDLHPAAELAPRDVVARGIARQMAAQQGQPVLLDATCLVAKHGPGFLARRFPSIDAATSGRGLDWSRDPIPVTPAAHYWMGGVQTDLYGRTTVPGLYAVGEVACTGVHGANRLASNSLLESLTFAWRCAHLFLDEAASAPSSQTFPLSSEPLHLSSEPLPFSSFEGAGLQPRHQQPEQTGALAPEAKPLQPIESPTIPFTRLALQTLLWNNVGIERTHASLQAAADQLSRWHAVGTSIHDLEDRNLLDIARVVAAAALAREESRGAHFRKDFPQPSAAFQRSIVYPQTMAPAPAQWRAADLKQQISLCET